MTVGQLKEVFSKNDDDTEVVVSGNPLMPCPDPITRFSVIFVEGENKIKLMLITSKSAYATDKKNSESYEEFKKHLNKRSKQCK